MDLSSATLALACLSVHLLACSWASVAISAARGGSVAAWNLQGAHTHHAHAYMRTCTCTCVHMHMHMHTHMMHVRIYACMHARDSRLHAHVHTYAQG